MPEQVYMQKVQFISYRDIRVLSVCICVHPCLKIGVLGAEPLGEGVAKDSLLAGARGRLPPPAIHLDFNLYLKYN